MIILFDEEKSLCTKVQFVLHFFKPFMPKTFVLEAALVPGNLLEAVAGPHEAAKRGRDLPEVPETHLSV
jgi:hypothetical protein